MADPRNLSFQNNESNKKIKFFGESWILMNILKYNKQLASKVLVSDQAQGEPDIFGIAAGGFGAADWFVEIDGKSTISASKYFSRIPREYHAALSAGRCRLLIDISIEGHSFEIARDYISAIHQALREMSIAISNCFLLSQNDIFISEYNNYCDENRLHDRIQMAIYDFCPRRYLGEELDESNESQRELELNVYKQSLQHPISKRFLCLNFTPRPHRVGFASWLFGKNYDDQGLISFRGVGLRKDGIFQSDLDVPSWFPDYQTCLEGARILASRGDIQIDLDPDKPITPDFTAPPSSIYNSTGLSIVTESDLSSGEMYRITEKSLKPMSRLHPFITIGNPRTLHIIRDLGFETFNPIINERYDDISDPIERISAVMNETNRILSMKDESF